jgi:hypothetical protein
MLLTMIGRTTKPVANVGCNGICGREGAAELPGSNYSCASLLHSGNELFVHPSGVIAYARDGAPLPVQQDFSMASIRNLRAAVVPPDHNLSQ